jgi:hypothetical protein
VSAIDKEKPMKNAFLTTIASAALFVAVVDASAQTMPPASITGSSASESDLAALKSVIETNAAERASLDAKATTAAFKLGQAQEAMLALQRTLDCGGLLKPSWPMSRDELIAYIDQQVRRMIHPLGDCRRYAQSYVWTGNDDQAKALIARYIAISDRGENLWGSDSNPVNDMPEKQATVATDQRAVADAKAVLAAFDNKAAKTVALAKLVQANIDNVKAAAEQKAADEERKQATVDAKRREEQAEAAAKARAEDAVKQAETDQARANEEQKAADETAKIERQAAAKRAEVAVAQQKIAETRKAAADATVAAKAEEARAAAQALDADTREKIAKAPEQPPKRQWWFEAVTPVHQCEIAPASPADMVEAHNGRIEDKGAWVDVLLPLGDATQVVSFFRTKDACEATKDAHDKAEAEAAHRLDQYR